MTDQRYLVRATNTHLYPGALLHTGISADKFGAQPRGLRIMFRDGVETDAELVVNTRGELAVAATAYRTASGTPSPARLWPAELQEREFGAVIRITGRSQPATDSAGP